MDLVPKAEENLDQLHLVQTTPELGLHQDIEQTFAW